MHAPSELLAAPSTPSGAEVRVRVERRVDDHELRARLLADVAAGLASESPSVPTRMLYGGRGAALFGEIADDPRYRLARRERALLARHAPTVLAAAGAEHVVELGSGASGKLLAALRAAGVRPAAITTFDVDEDGPVAALGALDRALGGGLRLHAVVGDLERDLAPIPREGRRLVLLLGSTFGNFGRAARARLLADVRGSSRTGDSLLLGVDVNRSGRDQLAAYRSAAVARFSRNALDELARCTGARVTADDGEHHVRWDEATGAVRVQVVLRRDVVVPLPGIDLPLPAGTAITTATSRKFDPELLEAELAAAGFGSSTWWFDEAGTHALVRAVTG